MIVFKTFLKVLNKNKGMILLYTAILLIFAGFNMENSETANVFSDEKPDIVLLVEDECVGLTKNLVDYLHQVTNVKEVKEEKIKDALFYRDVNMVIKIPKNYRFLVLQGLNPELEIQSTGDYQATLARMILEKYGRIQTIYQHQFQDESQLIAKINETLNEKVTIEMTSTIDRTALSRAKFYFNFLNYAILAGLVFVICLILAIFKEEKIKKRTLVSSMSYQKQNRILFLSSSLFAILLWVLYGLLGFLLIGKTLWSWHGFFFLLNAFLFSLCALSIALFLGNLIQNKEAINGVVNVIALGSSFLCGAFVPIEFLPKSVLLCARILPSYWFIEANEQISVLEQFDLASLKPVFLNMGILLLFIIGFACFTNLISRKKLKTQ